jgi:glycosyltransferase involved in cell wall biosynthesis
MMINEAIMCGTPVVSFDMGVAPDLVHTGKTGYRAKLRDSQDLATGITEILTLSEDAYNRMSYNCRELGLKLCHPKVQVESFERLIETALRSQRENTMYDGKRIQV